MRELFEEQMSNMIKEGILRKVNDDVPKRYLPLLAIVDLNRKSTKVRVCLDAKCKYKGISLNDALLKGKMDTNEILRVLIRFRLGKVAMMGDIQKMFWQILLHPENQKFHGVIWKGAMYIFTSVCFGDNNNSPPIAEHSIRLIAFQNKDTHARARDVLINKRYMDGVIDANDCEDEIIRTKNEIGEVLGEYGFKIKEWFSNNTAGEKVVDTKILGLKWNTTKDSLSVDIQLSEEAEKFTKRSILSKIASVWDPLGLYAAFLMKGRFVFQSVVRLKVHWDEEIRDVELKKKWKQWESQISDCSDVIVGRNLFPRRKWKSAV